MKRRSTIVTIVALVCVVAGLTAWQTSVRAVAKLTADDYMEIQQLYAKYYHSWDSGDADGWASVFTVDGNFNGTKGQEGLKATIINGPAKGTPIRHWQSNLWLNPTDDGVRAKVYVMQFDTRAKPITPITYSRYDDWLVKVNGKWLFKEKMRSSDTSMGGGRQGGAAGAPGQGAPGQGAPTPR